MPSAVKSDLRLWNSLLSFLGQDPIAWKDSGLSSYRPTESDFCRFFEARQRAKTAPTTIWHNFRQLKRFAHAHLGLDLKKYDSLLEFLNTVPQIKPGGRRLRPFSSKEINRFFDLEFLEDNNWRVKQVAAILAYSAQISLKSVRDINISDLQDLPHGIRLNLRNENRSVVIPNQIPGTSVSLANKIRSYINVLNTQAQELKGSHLNGVIKYVTVDNTFLNNPMGSSTLAKIPREIAQLLELEDLDCFTNICFTKRQSASEIHDEHEENQEDGFGNISDEKEDRTIPTNIIAIGDGAFSREDLERFVCFEDLTHEGRLKNQVAVIFVLNTSISVLELKFLKLSDVSVVQDDVMLVHLGQKCYEIQTKCHLKKVRRYIRVRKSEEKFLMPEIVIEDLLEDLTRTIAAFKRLLFSESQLSKFLEGNDLSLAENALAILSNAWQVDLSTLIEMDANTLKQNFIDWPVNSTRTEVVTELLHKYPDVNPFGVPPVDCIVHIGQDVAKCLNVRNPHAYAHARCFLHQAQPSNTLAKESSINQQVFSIAQFEKFLRSQKDGPMWILCQAIASVCFCSGLSVDNLSDVQRDHFQLSFEGYTMTIKSKSAVSKCTFIPFLNSDPTICMATAVRRYLKLWDTKSSNPQACLFQDQTIAKVLGHFEQEFKVSEVGIKVARWLSLNKPEFFVGHCFLQSAVGKEEELTILKDVTENETVDDATYGKIVSQEILDRFIDLDLHSHYWLVRKALMCVSFCLKLPMESLRTLYSTEVVDQGDTLLIRSKAISKQSRYYKPINEYLNDSGLRCLGRGYLFKERYDAMFRLSDQPLGKKVVQTIIDEAMSIYLQQELNMMDFEDQRQEDVFGLKQEDTEELFPGQTEDKPSESIEGENGDCDNVQPSPLVLNMDEETIKCKVEDGLDIFSESLIDAHDNKPEVVSEEEIMEEHYDVFFELGSPLQNNPDSEDEKHPSMTETVDVDPLSVSRINKDPPMPILSLQTLPKVKKPPKVKSSSEIKTPTKVKGSLKAKCSPKAKGSPKVKGTLKVKGTSKDMDTPSVKDTPMVENPNDHVWDAFIRSLTHNNKPSPEEVEAYLRQCSKNCTKSLDVLELFAKLNAHMRKDYGESLRNHPLIRKILTEARQESIQESKKFFSPEQLFTILQDSTLGSKFWSRAKAMLSLGTKFERSELVASEFVRWDELHQIKEGKTSPIRDYLNLLPANFKSGPVFKALLPSDQFGEEQMSDQEMEATLKAVLDHLKLRPISYTVNSLFGQNLLNRDNGPNPRWWTFLMNRTESKEPTEKDYLAVFENISEAPTFARNPWNHFRDLRAHHKRAFGFDINHLSGLRSHINQLFQEALQLKKAFTIEEVQRFINMEETAQDPYWLTRQAVAIVALCGQLHLFEVKLLQNASFYQTDDGVVVNSVAHHVFDAKGRKKPSEPSLFIVPFDHNKPDLCMASCIRRYYHALPQFAFECPTAEFFRAANHKKFKPQKPFLTKDMFTAMGEAIARLLDLPNPELYAHGKCFQIDPTGYNEFFEKTYFTQEDLTYVQLNFPSMAYPPKENGPPLTEEELLQKIDTLGILTTPFGEPEKSATDYKNGWRRFLLQTKTSRPTKKSYLSFIEHLKFEKKMKGKAIQGQFARLAHYHKKIYGTRLKDDHPDIIQIIDEAIENDTSTGNGPVVKRFTPAELDYFLRMELHTDDWLMKKAAVCLIMCGQLSMKEIRNMNISDLLQVDEGYLVNLPRPRKSFIVPYNRTDPGSCQATIVKRYLDRICQLSDGSTEGPFLKAYPKDQQSLVLDRRMSFFHSGQLCKEVAKILLLPNTKHYWTQSFYPAGANSQGNLTMDSKYRLAWRKVTDWLNTDNPTEEGYLRYFSHLKYVRQLKVGSMTSMYLCLSVAHQRNCGSKIQQWPSIRQLIHRDDVCGVVSSMPKTFTMNEIKAFLANIELFQDPMWEMRRAAVIVAVCGRLDLLDLPKIRRDDIQSTDQGVLVRWKGSNIVINWNKTDPHLCMANSVMKYHQTLGEFQGFIKTVGIRGEFKNEPISEEQALKIGLVVAKSMCLPSPELYTRTCFMSVKDST